MTVLTTLFVPLGLRTAAGHPDILCLQLMNHENIFLEPIRIVVKNFTLSRVSSSGWLGPGKSAHSFALTCIAQDALSTSSPVAPARKSLMVMRERKCELLGKRANRQCRSVSFSHIRNKKTQGVNLHEKRVWWAEGSKFVRLRLSTKGWRTVKKYGLNKAFAKFEVDLHQFQAQH